MRHAQEGELAGQAGFLSSDVFESAVWLLFCLWSPVGFSNMPRCRCRADDTVKMGQLGMLVLTVSCVHRPLLNHVASLLPFRAAQGCWGWLLALLRHATGQARRAPAAAGMHGTTAQTQTLYQLGI